MKTIELLQRYFKIKIIGSYLFVEAKYLEEKDIGDIDIVVDTVLESENIRRFLIDQGFKETQKPIQYRGYQGVEGSLIFKKEGELDIHVLVNKSLEVYSLPKLLGEKWNRKSKSDIIQLRKILEK